MIDFVAFAEVLGAEYGHGLFEPQDIHGFDYSITVNQRVEYCIDNRWQQIQCGSAKVTDIQCCSFCRMESNPVMSQILTSFNLEAYEVMPLKMDGILDWGAVGCALAKHQQTFWPIFRRSRDGFLKRIEQDLSPGDCMVRIQHNPGRLKSCAARNNEDIISQRACFLCPENLPPEQSGLAWPEDSPTPRYRILVNPMPIFDEHLTLVYEQHIPQAIDGVIGDFLALAKDFSSNFTLFYNGPRCGASAPDHLHFQAGSKGVAPIECQLDKTQWIRHAPAARPKTILMSSQPSQVSALPAQSAVVQRPMRPGKQQKYIVDAGVWFDGVRSAAVMISDDGKAMEQAFRRLLEVLRGSGSFSEEPMISLMAWYVPQCWIVIVFPRRAHRPACYHLGEENGMMISPGAVDMAGLVVVPLLEDYRRLDDEILGTIFREVSCDPDFLRETLAAL